MILYEASSFSAVRLEPAARTQLRLVCKTWAALIHPTSYNIASIDQLFKVDVNMLLSPTDAARVRKIRVQDWGEDPEEPDQLRLSSILLRASRLNALELVVFPNTVLSTWADWMPRLPSLTTFRLEYEVNAFADESFNINR